MKGQGKQAQSKLAAKQAKAKLAAKAARQGKKIRKHRVHTHVRFHVRPILKLNRKPKYTRYGFNFANMNIIRLARAITNTQKGLDYLSVLKHPLITEKDMKKMEDENTMVYIVDSKATKPQIKKAFEKIHSVTVRKVNVMPYFIKLINCQQILNSFLGKKKAYIRLSGESDALNLANKIGII